MSLDHEFLEMLPHTVQISPYVSTSSYRQNVYGAPVTYKCRIVGKAVAVRHADDQQVTSIYTIYIDAGDAVIRVQDQLKLPVTHDELNPTGAVSSRTPKIFTVSKITDESGNSHTVITCGWMYHRQGLV